MLAPKTDALPALELRKVNKWFGTNHANRDIDLVVEPGTIHGIIGENGAGKSTIMSIVYGFYSADSGEVLVSGEPVTIASPKDALAAGIGMVHQHFKLVDNFTVLENVILGVEGGMKLAAGMARARAELERLEREYGLEVSPDAVVEDLPVGIQQRVEILKALYRGADTLILDEPTGVLTPQEVDELFRILRQLREQGKTIIIITHKLGEVMALTDRVSVMRRGEMVAHRMTADTSKEELAELMVGRKVLLRVKKGPANPGATVLKVEGLNVIDGQGVRRVKDVSLDVRAGEIVGIAGVSGNGQSELLQALSGIMKPASGQIVYKGEDIAANPAKLDARALRKAGVGHVPEDRQREGLVLSFTAAESAILGYHDLPAYNRGLLMDRDAILAETQRYIGKYDVRPTSAAYKSSNFSGGNQQKLVLAREIENDPDLLLIGQPTRGVDIGAIEFIHSRLIEMRDAGKAILVVSTELDEVMSLSDRIVVMFDGHVVGELPASEADERILGLMMAGIDPKKNQAA
jgi:simple sugar transport system ATP-binding protein